MKRLLLFMLAGAVSAWTAEPHKKISKQLLETDPQSPVRVVVQWATAASETNNRKVLNLGGTVHYQFRAVPMGVYTLTDAAVRNLATDSDVNYISPDRPVYPNLDLTAAAVNATTVWNAGWNGSGIGVAVIDSGINPDPNLGPRKKIVFSYDFTDPNNAIKAANVLGSLGSPVITLSNSTMPAPPPPPGGIVPTGPPPASPALLSAVTGLNTPAPDQFGHGQHIAGIIASNGVRSTCPKCTRTFLGLAPGVNLLDLKVLDQNGQGSDSAVILAIDAAIALKNVYNVRVINLSLGSPVYESYAQDPLCQAVEAAWNAGIAVVVAAGNEGRDNTCGEQGYGTITAPGNDPYVITVGAMKTEGTPTRADDLIATYSSKGPTAVDRIVKPDIVAPGNLIVSLLAQKSTLSSEYPGNMVPLSHYQNLPTNQGTQLSPNYFILSGTSMAAAVVSGAVADLFEANPSLAPDQVKALLMATASKNFPPSSTVTDATTGQTFTDYYDIFTVGAGYIDLAAALASINSVPATGTALSPSSNYQNGTGAISISFDAASIWSNQAVWGTNWKWAANSVWSASELQGSQAVWDPNSMWAANPVWSTNSKWAANANSAESAPIGIAGEP